MKSLNLPIKLIFLQFFYCKLISKCSLLVGGKFNNYEYNSITEVVADIRLILENCYRYNGSNHWVSKLGHKVEKILEQKLALLNRYLKQTFSDLFSLCFQCKLDMYALAVNLWKNVLSRIMFQFHLKVLVDS